MNNKEKERLRYEIKLQDLMNLMDREHKEGKQRSEKEYEDLIDKIYDDLDSDDSIEKEEKYSGCKIMGMDFSDYKEQKDTERKLGKIVKFEESFGFCNDDNGKTVKDMIKTYYTDGSILTTWKTMDDKRMSKMT